MSTAERPAVGGGQHLFFAAGATAGAPTIVAGEGIHLVDDAGRRYIDVASGAMAASLGQGNRRVVEAMAAQAAKHTFSSLRMTRHPANEALTERIARLAGPGYERVHLSSGGSEAVEMAIKFLRQYAVATGAPERTRVISLTPSYHGSTLATIGWSGDENAPAVWGPLAVFGDKVPAPLSYRPPFGVTSEEGALGAAAALSATIRAIGAERVLAFLMEPIGGQASGANVPHPVFFTEVGRICREAGIFLVFDEIVTGARTGTFLEAHRHPDCRPDVIVMGKGIGAAYVPLGAVLAPAAMVDRLAGLTGFNLSHTYNANPIACAGAAAVLDEMVERDLIAGAVGRGRLLEARLRSIMAASPVVGDVRGRGLLLAVEYVRDKATRAVFPAEIDPVDRLRRIGLANGLVLYVRRQNRGRYGDWTIIAPPLVIGEDEIDVLATRLERTIAAFADEMARAGAI